MSASPEYLKGTVEVEVLESHNKARARRKDRDKTLKVGVDQALQSKDWLKKFMNVWG